MCGMSSCMKGHTTVPMACSHADIDIGIIASGADPGGGGHGGQMTPASA